MGYSIFSVGDSVRITSGTFAGLVGKVNAPASAAESAGTVVLSESGSTLLPVTVTTALDGHAVSLRVPPELLEMTTPGQVSPD